MIFVMISTRRAAITFLFFLLVSLANTAIPNRSNGEYDAGDSVNMYGDIEDGDYPVKPVTMFEILMRSQSNAPPESTETKKAPITKRTCYFNAGMSRFCDYKELLQSVEDANHWSSDNTPGRRRKRLSSSRGKAPRQRSTYEQ